MKEILRLGIAYNVFNPRFCLEDNHPSEESVEEMALEVYEALNAVGYTPVLIPLHESLLNFFRRIKEERIDVLINLCEGFLGQSKFEANVAAVYEMLGIPFTGNNSRALALCQDKFKTKAVLRAFGLPTARGRLMTSAAQSRDLSFPLIVKPNAEDASLGIRADSVVYDLETLEIKINQILQVYKQPALVEEYIEGREFNVAILEREGVGVEALPVSEIDFSSMPEGVPRICSYEAKWYEDHELYRSTPPICPAPIDDELRQKIERLALAAFRITGCRDYGRVDLRLGADGQLFVLEVNPNPDISLNAGYARALKAAGIAYHEFWEIMINNAFERRQKLAHPTEMAWSFPSLEEETEEFWLTMMERAARSRRRGRRW